MSTERIRVDDAQPLDDQRLLELGHLVLKSLDAEARAARAESQQAELQVAISEASLGKPDLLRSWLANYHVSAPPPNQLAANEPISPVADRLPEPLIARAGSLVAESANVRVDQPAAESTISFATEAVTSPAIEPEATLSISSWQQLLPHARERLASRPLTHDSPRPTSSVPAPTDATPSSSLLESDTDGLDEQNTARAVSETTSHYAAPNAKRIKSAPKQNQSHPQDSRPTDQEIANSGDLVNSSADACADDFASVVGDQKEGDIEDKEVIEYDSPASEWELRELQTKKEVEYEELAELKGLELVPRESSSPFFRSDKRGLLVSIVVHTVLIGSLMAITMRVEKEVASLGFESRSVDGEFESIEIAQAVEVAAPEVAVEAPSEPTMSSPSSLPSTNSVLSSSSSVTQAATSSSMASNLAASAGKAVASGGKPSLSKVNASFFGAAAGGNSFCYVIDGSESMRGGPWEAAKRELLRSLSTLKENQRFYIIFFNQELNAITQPGEREPSPTPLYATPENVKHAQNWVESLRIARGAPPDEALERAIELEMDAIYFLADGATKRDVPGLLRTKNRTSDFISGEQIRVPIHAIAFYSPEIGQRLMQKIASENKGQFIYVPDPRKK